MKLNLMLTAAALLTAGCGSKNVALEPTVVPKNQIHLDPTLADAVRFGMQAPGGAARGGASAFHAETPESWMALPPTEFRNPNYRLANVGEGEAYVTVLAGGGGGLESNVNRWRAQMGLAPLSGEEIEALPRIAMLDAQGVKIDWTGAYSGMAPMSADGVTSPRQGWRMVGALAELPDRLVTVKMTGPRDALENELANFDRVVQSLHDAAGHDHGEPATAEGGLPEGGLPAGHPPLGTTGMQGVAAAEFEWRVPDGWTYGPARQMRLATFFAGATGETEIALYILSGQAAGKVANIRWWYGQMGRPEPTEAEIEGLPTLEILGVKSPVVEITGDFSGMGREPVRDAGLIGAVVELPGRALFIKMTGPREEVAGQRGAFDRFCLSLTGK